MDTGSTTTEAAAVTTTVPAVYEIKSESIGIPAKQDAHQQSKMARVEAISATLAHAYQQASSLKLTAEESRALREPFRDDQVRGGAKGRTDLLYISHIHLSDRLNDVIGVGQWAIIRRSEKIDPVGKVYVDAALLVRGALVAEAIGSARYIANNPQMDYSDAIESALSDSLTRCCKRLGIGSQVWDKGFCDDWLAKYGSQRPATPPANRTESPPAASEPAGRVQTAGENQIVSAVKSVEKKQGSKNGKDWVRYGIQFVADPDNLIYGTFDSKLGKLAEDAKECGQVLVATIKHEGKFHNIVSLELPQDELPMGDEPENTEVQDG